MRDNFAQERHDLTALRCPLNSLHIQMVYADYSKQPRNKHRKVNITWTLYYSQ